MITTPLKWSRGEIQGRSHVWPIGTWSQVCRIQASRPCGGVCAVLHSSPDFVLGISEGHIRGGNLPPSGQSSHPPQEHQGSWGWRIFLTSTTSCPCTRSLRKESATNHPHRHHPRWTGGGPRWTEGMLFRGSYKGAASLQASSLCLAMPQTPSGRLRQAELPAGAT